MALRLAVYSFMQKSAIPQFRRSVFFYGKESLAVIKKICYLCDKFGTE